MMASGIILAGGRNSRMGTNKALLNVGQTTLLEGIVEQVGQFCQEIIVVTKQPAEYQQFSWVKRLNLVEDLIPAGGPLSGIHAGLSYSSNFHNFVVACDLPFLNAPLGRYMLSKARGLDVLVPRQGEYLQPLHAVYSKQCITPIARCLEQHRHKITAFYPEVKVGYLEEAEIQQFTDSERVFFNVNTPEDLARAKKLGQSKLVD